MKTFLIFLGSLAILTSCVKNNQEIVWLKVSEWDLQENGTTDEGVLTQNLSDAWVYVDNQFIGIFEVPFKIPVLINGNNKKIVMYPTIRNNGISATKKIYPFLEPYEIAANLNLNDTVFINPTTRYYDVTKFNIMDFEDGTNIGFLNSGNSPASIVRSTDPSILESFNQTGYGHVELNSSFPNWIANTTYNSNGYFPQLGAEVYLELDYHSTLDVITGVNSYSNGSVAENPNVQFNAQDPDSVAVVWKKIYIDMQTIVSGSPAGSRFEVSFESFLPEGVTSGEINIDNVKVVHF